MDCLPSHQWAAICEKNLPGLYFSKYHLPSYFVIWGLDFTIVGDENSQ